MNELWMYYFESVALAAVLVWYWYACWYRCKAESQYYPFRLSGGKVLLWVLMAIVSPIGILVGFMAGTIMFCEWQNEYAKSGAGRSRWDKITKAVLCPELKLWGFRIVLLREPKEEK